jgi:hypothetical protein
VTCTQAQTNQREHHRTRTGKKPIKALPPLSSPPPFRRPFRDSSGHKPPPESKPPPSKGHHYYSPSLQSLHARTAEEENHERDEAGSYPLNVRREGTSNQHRNRSATWRNVRPNWHTFRPRKGVIFGGSAASCAVRNPKIKLVKKNTSGGLRLACANHYQ